MILGDGSATIMLGRLRASGPADVACAGPALQLC